MQNDICETCGTQFAASEQPPERCPICEDERQFLGLHGQNWTTLERLRRAHHNVFHRYEEGMFGIGTSPFFAIGQRALLVRTRAGNVLWDCLTLIDETTVELVNALGGISAIGISHPHFYGAMVEWSHAFNAPIYLPAADREWVMRPDPAIEFWDGDLYHVGEGVTLIRCGGHFPGSCVLHWNGGAEGRGVLLTGDTIQVSADRKHTGFMYSYPNSIPLSLENVERIVAKVEPYAFDRMYGGWWDRVLLAGAKEALVFSASRYRAAVEGRDGGAQ